MAESYLLRLAVLDGNPSLAKEILKQMRSYLDNRDFLNRQLYQLVVAALNQEDCVIPKEWLKTIDHKASIYAKKSYCYCKCS